MKKHAFLIMAHDNFYNLKRLIQLLDYEDVDMFIHIDKKVSDFNYIYYENMVLNAGIYFFSEYRANWGGFSLVQCELFLLEKARSYGSYSYYHLLSGADLPLKKHSDIIKFFEINNGYEFVQYLDNRFELNKNTMTRRVSLYHWIQEYRKISSNVIVIKTLRYIAKILLGVQVLFRVNRVKEKNIVLKYGSQWFSLTNDFVEYLLNRRDFIYSMFRYTMCPDEFVIQTILYNSKFRDKIYQYKEMDTEHGNMREINWSQSENSAHPYVWTIKDKQYLMSSKMLFARKFDETIDKEIIDFLYENIKE